MPENYITSQTENGTVNISDEVISLIVSKAASEVEGIAGFTNVIGSDLADFLGIKNVPKGIKVSSEDDKIVVDVVLMVRYGHSVAGAARKVQDAVAAALEDMTAMKTVVNVHVSGISFEKAEIK